QVIIPHQEDIAMSATLTEQAVPTGTWTLDAVHSSVGFAVRHSGVSLFRGTVEGFEAELVDGVLTGGASASAISVQDESLQGHLLSPDFFDAEQFPRVAFESTSISRD